jgi:hypothetical protein
LVYAASLPLEQVHAVRQFAVRHRLAVKFAGFWSPSGAELEDRPFETLNLFRSARVVVTNTFHGVTLALKYGRPLVVAELSEKANKLRCTLDRFSIATLGRKVDEQALQEADRAFGPRQDLNEFIGRSKLFLAEALASSMSETANLAASTVSSPCP